jgi:hypothetical protein
VILNAELLKRDSQSQVCIDDLLLIFFVGHQWRERDVLERERKSRGEAETTDSKFLTADIRSRSEKGFGYSQAARWKPCLRTGISNV